MNTTPQGFALRHHSHQIDRNIHSHLFHYCFPQEYPMSVRDDIMQLNGQQPQLPLPFPPQPQQQQQQQSPLQQQWRDAGDFNNQSPRLAAPYTTRTGDPEPDATPKRGRGRPKGSKNKMPRKSNASMHSVAAAGATTSPAERAANYYATSPLAAGRVLPDITADTMASAGVDIGAAASGSMIERLLITERDSAILETLPEDIRKLYHEQMDVVFEEWKRNDGVVADAETLKVRAKNPFLSLPDVATAVRIGGKYAERVKEILEIIITRRRKLLL